MVIIAAGEGSHGMSKKISSTEAATRKAATREETGKRNDRTRGLSESAVSVDVEVPRYKIRFVAVNSDIGQMRFSICSLYQHFHHSCVKLGTFLAFKCCSFCFEEAEQRHHICQQKDDVDYWLPEREHRRSNRRQRLKYQDKK